MHFFEHPAKQYQLRKYFKNSDDVFVRPQRVSMTGEEEDKFLSQSGLPGFFQRSGEAACEMPEAAVSAWFPLQWAMAVTSRRLLPFGHLLNVGPSRKSSGTLNSCF